MKERGHDAYNRSLASLNSPAGPIRESQELKGDKGVADVSQGRPLNLPGYSSSVDCTPSPSVGLRRSNLENPSILQNRDCHGLDSPPSTSAQDHRHVQGSRTSFSRETESTSTNLETSTRQNVCEEMDSMKRLNPTGQESTSKEKDLSEKSQSKMDRSRSGRGQRDAVKSCCGSGNGQRQQHEDTSSHSQHASSSTPNSSRSNPDPPSRKEEFRHTQGQERQSRHTEASVGRSGKSTSDNSHGKMEKSGTREHHRKEERRQEGMGSSERRHTRSEGTKEYERRKARSEERNRSDEMNSNRGERRSTRSETSKEHARQGAKDSATTRGVGSKADRIRISDGKDRSHANIRDTRRHASPVKPHCSAQNLRKDQDDRRRTSGRTEESSRSKASSSCDDSRGDTCKSSYTHSGKGRSDKEKRVGTPDRGSKNAPGNASEDGSVHADGLANARRKSPVRLPSASDGSAMPEDSSPKRKLSFMETLNLTVSPIKKQNFEQAKEPVQPPPEDTLVIESTKDRRSSEDGEEFCIIDEVEGDSLVPSTNTTTHQHDDEPVTSLEVEGKELWLPQRIDGDLGETPSGKIDGTDSELQQDDFVNSDTCSTSISQRSVVDKTAISEVTLLLESAKPVDSSSVPLTDVTCKERDSQASMKKDKRTMIGAKNSIEEDQMEDEPEVQNDASLQEVHVPVMATASTKTCSNMDPSGSQEVVSSTVGMENDHQSKETIAVSDMGITQALENLDACPDPLVGPSVEAINVNTTAQGEGIPPEQASFSEPDSTEKEMEISKPSLSVVVPHDEDSMMLTLSNIKVIPEAISPLTSPVRQVKKSQQQHLGKEPHVKSLSKGQCALGFLYFMVLERPKGFFWFVLLGEVLCRTIQEMELT